MQTEKMIEGFRLSPQQKHLWLLQQGNNSHYRVQCAVRIEGNLNTKILKVALEKVVNRHEILRTTFHYLPGMTIPVQVINDSNAPLLQEHNLKDLELEEQKTKVEEIFRQVRKLPFDFEQYLLHLSLIALSSSEHVLLVSLPAVCADTATLKNLVREISCSYAACLQNEELLNEPMQYADISEWQNELIESEEAEIGRLYWQQDVSSLQTCKLPWQNQGDEKLEFAPEFLSLTLETNLVANIEALIQKYDTSPSVFFLACWQILLWRLTSHSEIIIGTAYDGRKYEELEPAIGLLEKYLPVHFHLEDKLQLQEILILLNESTRELYKWQEYFTWEQVVAGENGTGLSFWPFQFSFEEQSTKYYVGDLSFSIYQHYTCIERFNIKLSCIQTEDSLRADFHYDVGLFSVEDINRLMGQFQTLLKSLTNNPEAAISDLDILSDVERQQLLVVNNTNTDYQKHKCIHQLFEEQAERTPDNIAVVFENQQLTYAELNAHANKLAHHLRQLGVKPGVLVAVYLNRSLEMIPALLGILKAGGAYVPMEPSLPKARIQWLLSSLQINCLVTQSSQLQLIQELQAELPTLEHLICLSSSQQSHSIEQEVIEQASGHWRIWTRSYWDRLPKENLPIQASSDDIAYVIFTSGSTGTPKGVFVPHKPVINLIEWVNKTFNINSSDRVLFVTSLSFDLSVYDVFGLLAAGGSIRVASNTDVRDPSALLDILCNESITFWDSAPAALQQLISFFPARECIKNNLLRLVFLSGDWIPLTLPDLLKTTFPGVEVIALGGATEATVWSNYYPIADVDPQWTSIPYGKPIQNAQYYILDSYLNPSPIGVPGDLYIGGEVLSCGYINEPTLTAEKFIPNPFSNYLGARLYKTGDLARHLLDGNIEFLGRIDHQVKIRGFRIELGEIEAVLAQHPAVQETIILAQEDKSNKRLVAYLVVNQKPAPAINELRHFLQEKLPEYMVPASFVFLDALPLTSNGKVDRRALLASTTSRTGLECGAITPRDTVELQLVQIWEELLNIRPIGIMDNFFELGGHSLLAVRLMAQIQQQFQQDLPLSTLFQGATIEHLANTLRQQSDSQPWSPLVPIQTAGSKPPFFCVHPVGGNVLCYTDLASHLGREQPFYGLQAPGLVGEGEPFTRIEDMAAYYIAQMLVVQPQGPYFLGGWSLGGVVAFEMAQQLHSSGHQVAHVALIDSWAPIPGTKPTAVDRATLLTWFAADLGGRFGKDLAVSVEDIQHQDPDEQLNYVLQQARRVNIMPQDAGLPQIRRLLEVCITNLKAERSYVPQVYQNQITLFRASEELEDATPDPSGGWKQLTVSGVEIHTLGGNHYSIIREPHVQVLAQQLRASLDRASAVISEK